MKKTGKVSRAFQVSTAILQNLVRECLIYKEGHPRIIAHWRRLRRMRERFEGTYSRCDPSPQTDVDVLEGCVGHFPQLGKRSHQMQSQGERNRAISPKGERTAPQSLGIGLALKLGLPTICPLWNGEGEPDVYETCKITGQDCGEPSCLLDLGTNIDYRICDTFSQWFWAEVVKIEAGVVSVEVPPQEKVLESLKDE